MQSNLAGILRFDISPYCIIQGCCNVFKNLACILPSSHIMCFYAEMNAFHGSKLHTFIFVFFLVFSFFHLSIDP